MESNNERVMGIYTITHTATGRNYIGSSINVQQRWLDHIRTLRRGVHKSSHLQRAWDKYGADAFSFAIIERVEDVTKLLEREQHFFDLRYAVTGDTGFNVAPSVRGRLGIRKSLADRLLEQVKYLDNGCWQWIGHSLPQGYGRIGSGGRNGKLLLAHRASFETFVGPIPQGLDLTHTCGNAWCICPQHLEPVTTQELARRAKRTPKPQRPPKIHQPRPIPPAKPPRPPLQYFNEHIKHLDNGCWEWTGKKANTGAGRAGGPFKGQLATRIAYALFVGTLPHNARLLHTCDLPACVNPAHLKAIGPSDFTRMGHQLRNK